MAEEGLPQSPSPNRAKALDQYLNRFYFFLLLIPITIATAFLSLDSIPWNFSYFESICYLLMVVLAANFLTRCRSPATYLVDYALFNPPQHLRVPFATVVEHAKLLFADEPEPAKFQLKLLSRSGIGEQTCVPPSIWYIPPRPSLRLAGEEAELIVFSCVESLLRKTQIHPREIDILIANCSLYCPVPSITAMVINKYKLRSNVKSFNLSGMGCSAGLISIDLANDLLRTNPNSNAVVISTEILSNSFYLGKERSMLLPNTLFRMGGAAVLLSNKPSERRRAKYKLLHLVRTHRGADDRSYGCISYEEDPQGYAGIKLNLDLMKVAGDALKSNITRLAPLVLPFSEKLRYAQSLILHKFATANAKVYSPDFKKAFDHFCIHAGGRAVIDSLQKKMDLTAENVEASRSTLHRFGNTSSSSVWYELSYIESKGRMKGGDRVWQIAFGSGFKCNSAVWICNRTVTIPVEGPWADCIDNYPVHIPEVINI
ncbi:3-ketoacyl-CoA synthase 6-like [Andrographis paniculata]|uniref:3-ketoacyl-CoA synthase 6-like n=1 Tax=Andrographis paniculata TaxID=175694 RepID=UPI0021E74646|nr:3-ketoacyl-CoA synthase 6-like [Andrographis paniculata]